MLRETDTVGPLCAAVATAPGQGRASLKVSGIEESRQRAEGRKTPSRLFSHLFFLSLFPRAIGGNVLTL